MSQAATPLHELKTRRSIEFSDTDLAGIAHFSRFFVFMENAEHEFLRALGSSVHTEIDGQQIGWPRVGASCDFFRPVSFEDELDIHLTVARKGAKSMTYSVEFSCRGERVARGKISSVCCRIEPGKRPVSIEIPTAIARRITSEQTTETSSQASHG